MMVGQWTVTKPSRSDEVLDGDEQLRIANQVRAQFDSLAPKRPIKPNRSDPDETTPKPDDDSSDVVAQNIPELDKFWSLRSQPEEAAIISGYGTPVVQDEFVETEYYKKLEAIDKQHHTTGSGFIKLARDDQEDEDRSEYDIGLRRGHVDAAETVCSGYKSNPATNDWVPSVDHHQVYGSSKPNRSESS